MRTFLERARNNDLIKKINSVLNSYYLVGVYAVLSVLCSTFSFEWAFYYVTALLMVYSLLFNEDNKCVIFMLVMAYTGMSYETLLSGAVYTDTFGIASLCCIAGAVLFAFTVRFIIFKEYKKRNGRPHKLTYGVVAICISFFLAGLFSKDYAPINLFVALLLTVCFAFGYFYISNTWKFDKADLKYLSVIACAVIVVLTAELAIAYFTVDGVLASGKIDRNYLNFGCGGHNTLGAIMLMMLPFPFYLAFTEKRGYLYFAFAILSFVSIVFTFCRMATLVGAIAMVIGTIALIVKEKKYRKQNLIILAVLAVGIVAFAVIKWDAISKMFVDLLSLGFDDNGRFEIYKHGLNDFLGNPIFGVGYNLEDWAGVWREKFLFGKYHNTVIEVFATSGIVGVLAFSLFFYQIIKTFVKSKKNLAKYIMAFASLIFLLYTMGDMVFFVPGFQAVFMIYLSFMENDDTDEDMQKIIEEENSKVIKTQKDYLILKHTLDKFFALILLIVLLPLFIIVNLLIALDFRGAPMFRQKRVGENQKDIFVFKFRTMKSSTVKFDKTKAVIEDDNKSVTVIGRILRKFKIDELPQLINVLIGDMSFVGPRPLMDVYMESYQEWELEKFTARPGLTGLAQVNGNGYLEDTNRSYYDIVYARNVTFKNDVKIFFKTFLIVLCGEERFTKPVKEKDISELNNGRK